MFKLISVSNKTNIEKISKFFIEKGDKILTTGKTHEYLVAKLPEHKEKIIKVSEITKFPEILNGRVKTLHPKIFGGILCEYSNEDHKKEIEENQIPQIDGVIVNLYPFSETIKKYEEDKETSKEKKHKNIIENIDIGGVALIRAAAKNYENIITITNPEDYDFIINNELTPTIKKTFATKAFNHIFLYDKDIKEYFDTI